MSLFGWGACSSVASCLFVWFDFIVALIVCTLDCCGFCLRLLLVGFMCSFACLVLGDFCVLCWMFWFGFISGRLLWWCSGFVFVISWWCVWVCGFV